MESNDRCQALDLLGEIREPNPGCRMFRKKGPEHWARIAARPITPVSDDARLAIWGVDVAARELYLATPARRLLDLPAEESAGLADLVNRFRAEDRQRIAQAFWVAVQRGKGFDVAGRLDATGERWLRIRAFPAIEQEAPKALAGILYCDTDHMLAVQDLESTRRILDNVENLANLGVWDWDLSQDRLTVSDQWMRIHGSANSVPSLEEIVAAHAHPDDLPRIRLALNRAGTGVGDYDIEHRIVRSDGAIRWVSARGEVFRDPSGAPIRVRGASQDITEQKRADAQLRDNEERLRLTLEATNDGIWDLDVGSGRMIVNGQFFRLLGYAEDAFEPSFTDWIERIHPDDREPARERFLAAIAKDDAFAQQCRVRVRTGAWLCILCRGKVVERDAAGKARRMVGANTDVDHHRRTILALRESERNYRQIFNAAEEGIGIQDPATGRFLDVNDAFVALFGYRTKEEILGLDYEDLIPSESPYDKPAALEYLRKAMAGSPERFEWLAKNRSEERIWIEVSLRRTDLGGSQRILAMVRDITEQRERDRQLHLAARILESTTEGVMLTNTALRIELVNRAFTEITGYTSDEVLGSTPGILCSDRHDAEFYRALRQSLSETGRWRGEIWNRRKNGEIYPELLAISTIRDTGNAISHYVGVFSDITDLKRVQDDLEYLAHHDPLTHLPNRNLFRSRLEHGLQRAQRDRRHLAILFLDLQRFKQINDSLGHQVGDQVLIRVANSLSMHIRVSDTVSRMGGDEFVIIMEDLADPQDAATGAQKLLETFTRPLSVAEHPIYVAACIGIAIYPRDGDDGDSLLRHADMALNQAELQGANHFAFYSQEMDRRMVERVVLEAALRAALERGEMRVDYQAQVTLPDEAICGVEALLRWQNPELGAVSPERFVPLAEEIGLIADLGKLVFRLACNQLADWDRMGFCVPRMSVNLSIREFEDGRLVENIRRVLDETGIDASRIELEVTESVLMAQIGDTLDTLNALRGLGLRLAIDDFGTGYSSLAYLKRLPVQRLKIDRSFIKDLGRDLNDESISRAIIGLGRSLGLSVLAEGVETREQAVFLSREGCQEAQGYLFGRPMGAAALAKRWVDGGRSRRPL